MNLLFYIKPDLYTPYSPDCDPVDQSSPAMRDALPGDSIWVFSRNREADAYFLVSRLIMERRTVDPDFPYGCYHIDGGPDSVAFVPDGQPDLEPLLRSLSITINAALLAQSFQGPGGVRRLSQGDHRKLLEWSQQLKRL